MAEVSLKAVSAGYSLGNNAQIFVNGTLVNMTYSRGINMVVVNEVTGAIISHSSFDTNGSSSAANDCAAAIDAVPVGCLVVIAAKDDAAYNLTASAKRAISSLGSAAIVDISYRASFALLGIKGASSGATMESLSTTSSVTLERSFPLQPFANNGACIRAFSAGYGKGDVYISSDGLLSPSTGYGRGMNISIFDENTGNLLSFHTYDTYSSVAQSDQFAVLIEQLPVGRVAAVVASDDATWHLTQKAKDACVTLGSALISNLAYRGAWSLIGRKGAFPGSVAEALSPYEANGTALSMYHITPVTPEKSNDSFSVSVQSAGYNSGNYAHISVDDVVIPISNAGRGIQVAILDEEYGVVLDTATFDTYASGTASDAFATYIQNVCVGRLVLVAVLDDAAQSLNDNARRAMAMVGGNLIWNLQFRNSYALIGRKGGSPGSVLELISSSAVSTSFVFPVNRSAESPFNVVEVFSAGFPYIASRGQSFIKLNGNPVVFPGGVQRGLNVCTMDPSGFVIQTASYDTYISTVNSDSFASYIESLSAGSVVAISVLDEATWHLTERAKVACESLGSALIRNLEYRNSWTIIGKKGAAKGSVSESLSKTSAASCADWVDLPFKGEVNGVTVNVKSAGNNVGNSKQILVNGTAVAGTDQNFQVVVIDAHNGNVLNNNGYNMPNDSDVFATFIKQLPVGRLVALAVKGNVSMNDNAKFACELVGSGLARNLQANGSFAFVGIRGTSPGSMLERQDNNGSVGVRLFFPYVSTSGPRVLRIRSLAIGLFALFLIGVAVIVVAIIVEVIYISVTSDTPTIPAPVVPPTPNKRKAVVIGIDYSKVGGGLAIPDASKISSNLYRKIVNGGSFKAADTVFIAEGEPIIPSKTEILKWLKWLVSDARDGDVLLFAYLGHGGQDATGPTRYEYLITLNDTLTARQITTDTEFQTVIGTIPTKCNLTNIFHCCFAGGLADDIPFNSGRGISFCVVDHTTPALLADGSFTNLFAQEFKNMANKRPKKTYQQMLDYVKNNIQSRDVPVLLYNTAIYNVQTLVFMDPIP